MEYQLLKFVLQSGILSVSENKGLSDEAMKAVVQQTVSAAPSENQTAALTENESVILSTFPDGYSFAGLDKVDEQGLVYTIENRSDAYWLVVTGKFTQSGKSVFLLNARNITPVIEENSLCKTIYHHIHHRHLRQRGGDGRTFALSDRSYQTLDAQHETLYQREI